MKILSFTAVVIFLMGATPTFCDDGKNERDGRENSAIGFSVIPINGGSLIWNSKEKKFEGKYSKKVLKRGILLDFALSAPLDEKTRQAYFLDDSEHLVSGISGTVALGYDSSVLSLYEEIKRLKKSVLDSQRDWLANIILPEKFEEYIKKDTKIVEKLCQENDVVKIVAYFEEFLKDISNNDCFLTETETYKELKNKYIDEHKITRSSIDKDNIIQLFKSFLIYEDNETKVSITNNISLELFRNEFENKYIEAGKYHFWGIKTEISGSYDRKKAYSADDISKEPQEYTKQKLSCGLNYYNYWSSIGIWIQGGCIWDNDAKFKEAEVTTTYPSSDDDMSGKVTDKEALILIKNPDMIRYGYFKAKLMYLSKIINNSNSTFGMEAQVGLHGFGGEGTRKLTSELQCFYVPTTKNINTKYGIGVQYSRVLKDYPEQKIKKGKDWILPSVMVGVSF